MFLNNFIEKNKSAECIPSKAIFLLYLKYPIYIRLNNLLYTLRSVHYLRLKKRLLYECISNRYQI